MGRPGNRCARCSGPLRGRNGRRADIVGFCSVCNAGVCTRHITWDSLRGGWICTKRDSDHDNRAEPEEEAHRGR